MGAVLSIIFIAIHHISSFLIGDEMEMLIMLELRKAWLMDVYIRLKKIVV